MQMKGMIIRCNSGQTIIRSFESEENYTVEYSKNRIIISPNFSRIMDKFTRFIFRKLTIPHDFLQDRRRTVIGVILSRYHFPEKCKATGKKASIVGLSE